MTPIDANCQAASDVEPARGCIRMTAVTMVMLAMLFGSATAAAPANASSPGLVAAERREPPDVRNLTLPEARNRILSEWYPGFTPTVELDPEVPDQVPPETALVVDQAVIRYLEDSDDAAPVAAIRLTPGALVPDLEGRSRDEAEALLDAQGLFLKSSGTGLVTSQDPAAGIAVPFGTTVVAELEPTSTIGPTVPSVLGLTEADATAELERVKLKLVVGSSSGKGERVVTQQDPPPGVPIGSSESVTVTLKGDDVIVLPTVAVPDVSGLELDAVHRVLDAAGLTLAVDPTGDSPEPGALAFRQDLKPGSQVPPGTTVTVAFAAVVVDDAAPVAWWVLPTGAAVLALLLLALWSLHLFRRKPPSPPRPEQGQPSPPTPAVTVHPNADLHPATSVTAPDPSADLAIQVVPGADTGTLTLLEERP